MVTGARRSLPVAPCVPVFSGGVLAKVGRRGVKPVQRCVQDALRKTGSYQTAWGLHLQACTVLRIHQACYEAQVDQFHSKLPKAGLVCPLQHACCSDSLVMIAIQPVMYGDLMDSEPEKQIF